MRCTVALPTLYQRRRLDITSNLLLQSPKKPDLRPEREVYGFSLTHVAAYRARDSAIGVVIKGVWWVRQKASGVESCGRILRLWSHCFVLESIVTSRASDF